MIAFISRYDDADELVYLNAWNEFQRLEFNPNENPDYPMGFIQINQMVFCPEQEAEHKTRTYINVYTNTNLEKKLYTFVISKDGIEKTIEKLDKDDG